MGPTCRPGSRGCGRNQGGSWLGAAKYCRSADRFRNPPGFRFVILGFRLLRTMLQGCQGLVLGGTVSGEFVNEAAGKAGGDPGDLEVLLLAPGEEAPHDAGVGTAGVRIGDPGGEELIGGKEGIGAGALEDGRDRSGRIEA